MTDQRRSERLTDPTHTAGTPEARSAAHGHARAVKRPSPSERPAALAQSTWTTAAACQAGAYGALDELAELTRRLAELVHLDPDTYDSTLDALHRTIDQATDQARERLRTAPAHHHAKETSDE